MTTPWVCGIETGVLLSLRLRNFRSLRDTGELTLRPIVVLVGANSSGKSSLLRFFPLLRQTEEGRSSGPLLWFAERGYVDFGDFKSALYQGAEPPVIQVEATLQKGAAPLTFVADVVDTDGVTGVSALKLSQHGDAATLTRAADEALTLTSVNGRAFSEQQPIAPLAANYSSLVPELADPSVLRRGAQRVLVDEVWRIAHGHSSGEKLAEIAARIRHGSSESVLRDMRSVPSSIGGVRRWERLVSSFSGREPIVGAIKEAVFVRDLPDLLRDVRHLWRELALGVRYIGPFRRAPQRYYRKEAVGVDEISQAGDNLAMFLWSLPQREREVFSAWVREHFGFGVSAKAEGAHVVLTIDPGAMQREAFNLVDMGFGISQLLPVVAQCWIASRDVAPKDSARGERPPSLLAIEQPELHLHPHHQYGLAELFTSLASAVRSAGRSMPIVIETHSEAMLHRFGELVEAGRLARDDISVLLFHKQTGGETTLQEARFNAEGLLENWPLGFFRA